MADRLGEAMEVVKPDDLAGHRLIWTFSDMHMDPKNVPGISALAYGASRILLPEMHWDSTPDLLDIFALAETIRQQTVQSAHDALVWDEFYRKGGSKDADGEPLSAQERKTLRSIVKKNSDQTIRETYRTVIMQVCWAHIHFLRRSSQTLRIAHFFYRYFPPASKVSQSEEPKPLWLRGLSESELVAYDATRQKLKEFLRGAEEWEEKCFRNLGVSESDSQPVRATPEYQAGFCAQFPLIVEWGTLTGVITRHLTKVKNMASKLHSIFAESDSSSNMDGVSPILRRSPRESQAGSTHRSSQHRLQVESFEATDAALRGSDGENKNESQESNASSKLSYVDPPANVVHAPPTSLLQRRVGAT